MNTERIELAPEPGYGDVSWVSAYDVDPFAVSPKEKTDLLAAWSAGLLAHPAVTHADVELYQVKECKFYTDGATTATQQRVRLHPQVTATAVTEAGFDDMRTLAPPAGRGWEYLTGTGWNFQAELAELPELLAEKLKAPSVEAGRYDLVIDPSNLWLTIHESIGHATELDRALGYEAAYAGTSFATLDKLGTLQYGSRVMHVTGDRVQQHGLATVGYDDEGVAGQSWDLIAGGVLVGYQLDRRMAQLKGFGRSNGCAFADSPGHMPLQRMANVSLQPAENGPSADELIAGVEDGVYILGDKSWSIDMQRYNFQFTGQRVLPDQERPPRRPAQGRGLPGDDDRLLELDGGGRRPADVRARRGVQLRQGPARAGGAGEPRGAGRALPLGAGAQHRGRRELKA